MISIMSIKNQSSESEIKQRVESPENIGDRKDLNKVCEMISKMSIKSQSSESEIQLRIERLEKRIIEMEKAIEAAEKGLKEVMAFRDLDKIARSIVNVLDKRLKKYKKAKANDQSKDIGVS